MQAHFLVVLGQVATLFLLMGVGFLLTKIGWLTKAGTAEMTTVLLYVVTPCIIVDSLQKDWDPALLHTLAIGTAAVLLVYLLNIPLSTRFFHRREPELRAPLQFGCIYGNVGFMGLPLAAAVLGEDALIFAVVTVVVFNLFTWTHGILIMGGRAAFSARKLFLNPGVIATAIGLPLFLLRIRLPGPVGTAVSFLGDLNTPLAMIVIGAQMARADLLTTFRNKTLYAACGIKLIFIPLLSAAILLPFRLDPVFYTCSVILTAVPTAGVTSIFAEKFDRSPVTTAQLVTLSTLLSIATLPVLAVAARARSQL